MPRRPKRLPEKLYASTVSWEGWTFHVLSSMDGLRWIDLSATPFDRLAERLSAKILPDDVPNEAVLRQLHEYLKGSRQTFDLPLDLRGTPFQLSVWEALDAIPYGETTSYGEIAEQVGRPRAVRAVGQAVGANPVAIVLPCHRVIGSSGNLTGYAGGLPLKERLLALEKGSLSL